MYPTLKFLHSYWAYLVLVVVVLATINAVVGLMSKREFSARDFRLALFALIVTHIQLLLGIVLFVVANDFGENSIGEIMKDSALRMRNVEHPFTMLIVAMLITIGYSKHKKLRTSASKLRTIAVTYGLALLAMLAMIPWKNWFS